MIPIQSFLRGSKFVGDDQSLEGKARGGWRAVGRQYSRGQRDLMK